MRRTVHIVGISNLMKWKIVVDIVHFRLVACGKELANERVHYHREGGNKVQITACELKS